MILGSYDRDAHAHIDENMVIATMLSSLSSAACMFDIGAHQGYAFTPFAKMGWTIVALEPDHNNRAILEERASLFDADIVVDERAVSRASGLTKPLFTSEESTGISSLYNFTEGHTLSHVVETITLDDLVSANKTERIDFLKIDVEGAEMDVLEGFSFNILPRVISAEFEDSKTVQNGYSTKDIADKLSSKGYEVFVSEWHPVIRYGIRHDWKGVYRFTEEQIPPSTSWGNIIALQDPSDVVTLQDKALWSKACRFYTG